MYAAAYKQAVMSTTGESYMVRSVVRGYHLYKQIWSGTVGQRLHCQQEVGNTHDPYVEAVTENGVTVGQVPRSNCSKALFC